MSQTFGMESPGRHNHTQHRAPARYIVVIDSAGSTVARLFMASREPAGEFDAGSEELAVMTRGLSPTTGALGSEWDQALSGHSSAERRTAEVYTLSV